MSGFRIPGPVCVEDLTWSIRDGTSALWSTPTPGPVCLDASWSAAVRREIAQADLGMLFRSCLNPLVGLTDDDYAAAAKTLGVDVATIQAVAEVETSGKAFDTLGRPRILFERHYFHRLTGGRYDQSHATISAKLAGGYGKFSAQYDKLEEAFALDADAALSSASWGRFQIMGSNYHAAGFTSVRQFVLAMTRSEAEHLKAFARFVSNNPAMVKALQKKDWAGFARAYNGKGYRKNLYDDKLKNAYERLAPKAVQPVGQPAAAPVNPSRLP
ncbi:N-acetylmuramidase family protein [Pseudorhodoferax sp.]|uniref:N-acetylmuramidase family protein n=1 Tax=Pseudorhodoferax sp. TaxID=1993553 RepID=UPI0039E22EE6